MNASSLPRLTVSREEAIEKIQARMNIQRLLLDLPENVDDQLRKCESWSEYNETLLAKLFDGNTEHLNYKHFTRGSIESPLSSISIYTRIKDSISSLASICERIYLYEQLAIAHEIEGDILDIAQGQVEASETPRDSNHKQLHLGIAAFLAGAALEDALRRLCDANGRSYNPKKTSITILRGKLYQPSNQIEVISQSETKQITAWGDTRNNADHGRFSEITHSEVLSMVIGVRGFIDKHLP